MVITIDLFDVLKLMYGLALFLFGMDIMSDAMKKGAGNQLKAILASLTSNTVKGFLLGLGVTAIIQSSSATTVMVVGFVNSGAMTLYQAVGVIMGANVGTAVTSWLTGLSGVGAGGEAVSSILQWMKPDTWVPILCLIGLGLTMFSKKDRKRDFGTVFLGFGVLMIGMETMSGAVSVLRTNVQFQSLFVMFRNPILGVVAGMVLTAIVQSSSASVGILQSLTTTGAITYGAAIPIIMGQNIGTCVTAMISAFSANKNGKRAALIHLYFNIIGVLVWLNLFYLLDYFLDFTFVDYAVDMWGIAGIHTIFKVLCVLLFAPFTKQLERLATVSVKDSKEEENVILLDDRLMQTPSVAVKRCEEVTIAMAETSCEALRLSLKLLKNYDKKVAQKVREYENRSDEYEDILGSYLVKLSACDLDGQDSHEITKLLHVIGDFERISDHAVSVVISAEEIEDNKIVFSEDERRDLDVLSAAVDEIIGLVYECFRKNSVLIAEQVEPLEQVVDYLTEQMKMQSVLRLQKKESTIQHGFIVSDILNSLERASDHCSNIAGCVIEISGHGSLLVHQYLGAVKDSDANYNLAYKEYRKKYQFLTEEASESKGLSREKLK
ncbi:MAG: Na/Pi cotransporter family protein [Lachnospiraceae bacterium]|nr:Na/Pi cotransporter family protein [Lachnospiraceae bacterium]